MPEERRRADDDRIDKIDRKVESVATDVRSIRDMLISEPEASPLGRALLQRSVDNRKLMDARYEEFRVARREDQQTFQTFYKEDFEPLDDWWNQSKGAWKFVLGMSTVLGIIGAFFGLVSFFGPR